ncbi:unnamed protein product [Paramecium sonneborni]|uniref:Uncharacterized protein n=1 Tax=Paramecium sonneborni TaxID=65129 RepID=A0A8S1MNS8_9CILI|nr:unnamed protein product [Paramecium sonneborni]
MGDWLEHRTRIAHQAKIEKYNNRLQQHELVLNRIPDKSELNAFELNRQRQ